MKNKKFSCVKALTFAVIHGVPRKDHHMFHFVSSGAARTVLQPDSFIHESHFLRFVATCGDKKEHFFLALVFLPSYFLEQTTLPNLALHSLQ